MRIILDDLSITENNTSLSFAEIALCCHLCLYPQACHCNLTNQYPMIPPPQAEDTGRGALYRLFIYITGLHSRQKTTHQQKQCLPLLSNSLQHPPFFIVLACNPNTNPDAFYFKVISIFSICFSMNPLSAR